MAPRHLDSKKLSNAQVQCGSVQGSQMELAKDSRPGRELALWGSWEGLRKKGSSASVADGGPGSWSSCEVTF